MQNLTCVMPYPKQLHHVGTTFDRFYDPCYNKYNIISLLSRT